MEFNFKQNNRGFTLIELLVVIAIIAVLVAFAVTNFIGARTRASDLKKKSEMQEVKKALRLYYNDYNSYPPPDTVTSNTVNGCGSSNPPVTSCGDGGEFYTTINGSSNVYMKLLPPSTSYVWNYVRESSGDDFCLWADLENQSDSEIVNSQARCSSVCDSVIPAAETATAYVVCAD